MIFLFSTRPHSYLSSERYSNCPQAIQWNIVDKETIDEIIFRTTNARNRLMLELMARGGMRVGEVLNTTQVDIQEHSLTIQSH